MSRVVALSDTHSYHPVVPDGDILIHAGDISGRSTWADFRREIFWLGALPHEHKMLVPGNHELQVEINIPDSVRICRDNGIQLAVDGTVLVDSLILFCSSRTPVFGDWAFMHDEKQAESLWVSAPSCDILVTHGPPYGYNDKVKGVSLGCRALRRAIDRIRPSVHVYGHIHEGYNGRIYENGTLFANVAILDGGYRPAALPFVFDIEKSEDDTVTLNWDNKS